MKFSSYNLMRESESHEKTNGTPGVKSGKKIFARAKFTCRKILHFVSELPK